MDLFVVPRSRAVLGTCCSWCGLAHGENKQMFLQVIWVGVRRALDVNQGRCSLSFVFRLMFARPSSCVLFLFAVFFLMRVTGIDSEQKIYSLLFFGFFFLEI